MDTLLSAAYSSIQELGNKVLACTSNDATFAEIWGWNCPPLTRQDLSNMAFSIANKIMTLPDITITDDQKARLQEIPHRVAVFNSATLVYLGNGNASQASYAYLFLIKWISDIIDTLYGWEVLENAQALPKNLTLRLRSMKAELGQLNVDKAELESQIRTINDATEAALSLPTDLQTLRERRNEVNGIASDAAELYGKIDTHFKNCETLSKKIEKSKEDAEKIVANCDVAYSIATTQGLAAAFDKRATNLNRSMWVWVGGLLLSLIAGGWIGYARFQALAEVMVKTETKWGVIWIDFVLSILGLAAPIWFAWLATKQISQRFKLSEDYAFKASVAKAYEGYRKQAVSIDPTFESRLFSSALDRLDEAPLRFVENDNHGSPWSELLNSDVLKKALDNSPEVRKGVFDLLKRVVPKSKGSITPEAAESQEAAE